MKRCLLAALLPIAGLTFGTGQLHAGVLLFQFVSQSGGTYNYELTLTNPSGDIFLNAGQHITLTGLSGVTGESISGGAAGFYDTTCGFTSTSACFNLTSNTAIGPASGSNVNIPTFTVTSSVLTTASVNWLVQSEGTDGATPTPFSGTTTGPVGTVVVAAPEPGTVGMVVIGVLALVCRRVI